MLQETSQLALMLERVSELTDENRQQEALLLVSQYLAKSNEKMATAVADALYQALPPWTGDELRQRLEVLATYWAFALVSLGFPSLDPAETRVVMLRRAFRLRNRLQGQLNAQKLYGHLHLLEVLDGQFHLLIQLPAALRSLSASRQQSLIRADAVVLEAVVIAGTFKAALSYRLLEGFVAQLSQKQRQACRDRVFRALHIGLAQPWSPVLSVEDEKLGRDILADDGLAQSKPLEISPLRRRVVSRKVIDEQQPQGFVVGLTKNPYFRQSAEIMGEYWRRN